MNRRDFLAKSILAAGAMAPIAARGQAASPCPPPALSAGGPSATTTCTGTALSQAALALVPGQSASFTQGANTNQLTTLDIQWQTSSLYYDAARREAQYMGKPASSQSTTFTHYVYSEATSTWRRTQPPFSGTGHIWNHALDPATGDYYTNQYSGSEIYRYRRAADSWDQPTSIPHPYNTMANVWGGFAWHPNLFGSGDGGLVVRTINYLCAWRKSANAWTPLLGPFAYGEPGFNNTGGGDGVYYPDVDRVLCGTGNVGSNSNGAPLFLVPAGSGGAASNSTTRMPSSPPVLIFGAGANTVAGKMLRHPSDPRRTILFEKSDNGSARWWLSADRGSSWSLQPGSHPFGVWKQWTCGLVADYGVIWGISSGHDGGGPQSRLWKPA